MERDVAMRTRSGRWWPSPETLRALTEPVMAARVPAAA
jgi:hypothetical protein